MKENDRIEIVNTINDNINYDDIELNATKDEINKLLENEFVKKYLLLKDYLRISTEVNEDNERKRKEEIYNNFLNKLYSNPNCEHDGWIYTGSYSKVNNDNGHESRTFWTSSENDKNFSFNCYECLECGKVVRAYDYENFEKTHYVLKKYAFSSELVDCARKYRRLYYESLFSNETIDALNDVVEEFNIAELKLKK